jgi:hypothetical protein
VGHVHASCCTNGSRHTVAELAAVFKPATYLLLVLQLLRHCRACAVQLLLLLLQLQAVTIVLFVCQAHRAFVRQCALLPWALP